MKKSRTFVAEPYPERSEIKKIIEDYLTEMGTFTFEYEAFAEEQKKIDSIIEQTYF